MNRSQDRESTNQTSRIEDDAREEYAPPEIIDLGDVGAITKSAGCGFSGDGGYS